MFWVVVGLELSAALVLHVLKLVLATVEAIENIVGTVEKLPSVGLNNFWFD